MRTLVPVPQTSRRRKAAVAGTGSSRSISGGGATVSPLRGPRPPLQPLLQPIHVDVEDRRHVERQELREEQAADDREPERPPRLRARAQAERDRQRAHERGHRRHHDRPEADEAGLVDRLLGVLAFVALRLDREVDHHDPVLLDEADEQDDADEGVDRELRSRRSSSVTSAPKPANGSAERIVSGWMKLS